MAAASRRRAKIKIIKSQIKGNKMAFFAGIFFVLSLIGLLVAVIGPISPSSFKDPKTGEIPTRRSVFGGGLAVFFVCMAIGSWLDPEVANDDLKSAAKLSEVAKPTQPEPVKQAPPEKTLGMTPEQFRKAFNSVVGDIDDNYKTAEFEIETGEVNDIFKRDLGDGVSLLGVVNKADGSIKEVMIMAGRSEDIVRPISVLLVASQVLNPKVAKEDIAKAVLDLINKAIKDMETATPHEQELGSVNYMTVASEYTGLALSISQAD